MVVQALTPQTLFPVVSGLGFRVSYFVRMAIVIMQTDVYMYIYIYINMMVAREPWWLALVLKVNLQLHIREAAPRE